MVASNTKDCFRECIGKRVKGVLFDALLLGGRSDCTNTKTLIFDDGTGLTLASNGSFWLDNKEDVRRAIEIHREKLEASRREIVEVLIAAGEPL